MLSNLLRNGFSKEAVIMVLLSIPVILFALTIHEFSHGYAAKLMGDKTAYNLGRLSLNPIKHLDVAGTLMMFIFGFGWAKPVPVNSRNFKNPKWGMAITAMAGPISNLIMAYIFYVIAFAININAFRFITSEGSLHLITAVYLLFYVAFSMNLTLAIFNLIPVPPLDGSRILFAVLPTKLYFQIMKYERYIYIAVIVALFTGILDVPLYAVRNGIESLFELSVSWMV